MLVVKFYNHTIISTGKQVHTEIFSMYKNYFNNTQTNKNILTL